MAASFDLKTYKIIHRIKTEPDADGVLFDPASGHVFVVDGDFGKITVIDPKTDGVVATVDGGGGLEFGAVGGNGKLYVDGVEKEEIVRIDTVLNKAGRPLAAFRHAKNPRGLAVDSAPRHRLFASCANKVLARGRCRHGFGPLRHCQSGRGESAAAFDPRRNLDIQLKPRRHALHYRGEIARRTFEPLPAVATQFGARTMALDPKSGRIYLVTADFNLPTQRLPRPIRGIAIRSCRAP